MDFRTTMIIGLGGIGCKIVEAIYTKFNESNPSESDRRNVAFLCLDTDEADIAKRQKVMPKDCVIKTSSDKACTVGAYIENIQGRTTVRDWFDTRSKEVLGMALNEGAAQLRMCSRLAYMSAIDEGKLDAINNSIARLLRVDPERHAGNDIKVHIISSLAGGTGAGSFLQVAYYVKQALHEYNNNAPKITGYFLLANTLCNDSSKGFSKAQKENTRSNTYACIKEQVAFSSSDHDKGVAPINFEYRLGQENVSLPVEVPYDYCYMVDYTGSNGGNLALTQRYADQISMFVYLNAFSPVGDNQRTNAINNIRQKIEDDGDSRYAAIGVSKLIYPVNDLFDFFSRAKVVDNLSASWLRIDRDFKKLYAEYKKKIAEGRPATEPDRGQFFMENVIQIAKNGNGREAVEFNQIYNSTQILGEDMMSTGTKADLYLNSVKKHIEQMVTTSTDMEGLYNDCKSELVNFIESKETTQDVNTIMRREKELEDYQRKVLNFISNNTRTAIWDCFLTDSENEGYVNEAPHCLNTYILEKGKEMHPLAVRYFLYDVRKGINARLGKMTKENDTLISKIENYAKAFDNPDTPDIIEGPVDSLKAEKSLAKKLLAFITRQDAARDAKEDYINKSKSQCKNLRDYSINKLLENTYTGLLSQINRMIEESEQFFDRLPDTITNINNEIEALLAKQDGADDPSIQYVLSSSVLKKDIYDAVIAPSASPFFPEDMSAALYRGMFTNVFKALTTSGPATNRRPNIQKIKEEKLAADKFIIDNCIAKQNELLKNEFRKYSEMNVLEALKEEALRETGSSELDDRAFEYMKNKFHAFRDRAQIWGADNLDESVRYINAWGLNPVCDPSKFNLVGNPAISQEQANELYGDTAVDTNPLTAATRLSSGFFNPCEIIRANAVTLLKIDKNFKDFMVKDKTDLVNESIGTYAEAYFDVINRVKRQNPRTYSPHLDKHWHLPAFMPNIGSSMTIELYKLFKALCYGLLLNKFRTVEDGGSHYWEYMSSTSRWIKGFNGKRVAVGSTQGGAFNALLEQGLANNPDMVDEILIRTAESWKDAANEWNDTKFDETNEFEMMKKNVMVRRIVETTFKSLSFSGGKENNWFTLLDANKNTKLYTLIENDSYRFNKELFDDIFTRLLSVFGPSTNTYNLCKYIVDQIKKETMKEAAMARLEKMNEDSLFEPTN